MEEITVEEYIKTKIEPELQPLAHKIQEIWHKYAPESKEVIAYAAPMWKGNKLMSWITPAKAHISLGFYRGTEFKDPNNLLEGTGKDSRHVKLKSIEDLEEKEAAIQDFIKQALAFDNSL